MNQLHQVARDLWERELLLAHRLKRLRSVPHPGQLLPVDAQTFIPFVVRSFRLTHHRPTIIDFSAAHRHDSFYSPFQGESRNHVGGRRWIPTQEQLSVLEMLYRGGMRRPNAQQIEQITSQLVKYGRIESKNVFYWFQNQKTRQRQKERLAGIASGHYPPKPSSAATTTTSLQMQTSQGDSKERENNGNKRKSRRWLIDLEAEEESNGEEKQQKTLELFPLHPCK